MSDKLLPQAIDVENAVLSRLMDNGITEDLVTLSEDHFFDRSNRQIYTVIDQMLKSGDKVNPIILTQKFKDLGTLDVIGGPSKLSSLSFASVWHPQSQYFPILDEKLKLRRLIYLSEAVSRNAYENTASDVIIEKLGRHLIAFEDSKNSGNVLPQAVEDIKKLIERKESGEVITGLKTGIIPWDQKLGGLNNRFYVLAARAGMGKTAIAEQIIDTLASNGEPVLIFEKDMSVELLVQRLACRRALVPFVRFDLNHCNKYELGQVMEQVKQIEKWPLYVYSPPSLTAAKFHSIVKIEQRIHGIKAVFLDHILNMDVGTDYRVGLTQASTMIRSCCQETKIPHVILAQLNRGAHTNDRPSPAHIKEFDALYADCDTMIMLWSDTDVQSVQKGELFPMKFLVNKNRGGMQFEEQLGFDGPLMTFKPMLKL